jgi:hypothetical protein
LQILFPKFCEQGLLQRLPKEVAAVGKSDVRNLVEVVNIRIFTQGWLSRNRANPGLRCKTSSRLTLASNRTPERRAD